MKKSDRRKVRLERRVTEEDEVQRLERQIAEDAPPPGVRSQLKLPLKNTL